MYNKQVAVSNVYPGKTPVMIDVNDNNTYAYNRTINNNVYGNNQIPSAWNNNIYNTTKDEYDIRELTIENPKNAYNEHGRTEHALTHKVKQCFSYTPLMEKEDDENNNRPFEYIINDNNIIDVNYNSRFSSIPENYSSSHIDVDINNRYKTLLNEYENYFPSYLQSPQKKETFTIIKDEDKEEKTLQEFEEYHINMSEYITDDNNEKEAFTSRKETIDHTYITILESHARMIINFVSCHEDFKHWKTYWKYLQRNFCKCNGLFEILNKSDADVAYVENKGETMKFRIRDDKRYVPINIYEYVLIHEMAHLANGKEWGHGKNFQMLMHLLEVAAFELRILNVEKYPENSYISNNTPILSKRSIKAELYDGIKLLIETGGNKEFYNDLYKLVEEK